MSTTWSEPTAPALGRAAAHVAASNVASDRFFAQHANSVAQACHAMAARFRRGGRLLAYGEGARRSDVSHVVVEFVHPVIVGKRALPAVALDTPRALDVLGRPEDIVLLMSSGAPSTSEAELLRDATARGMLALALTGVATRPDAEFHFPVAADDPLVVQEAHEVLYHVLWELVHVFVEHREAE